jgi:HTTM domain
VSLHARNPLVLNFGDAILRVCLFWALFLPLGSRWSLDAARSGRAPDASPVCSVAGAAFLLQVCFIYFFTAVEKSGPDWHETGLALYYALQLDWMALPPAVWLREQILLTKLLSWGTLAFEYVGPFLILAPLWPIRLLGVLGFGALHLGISATLRLGVFPWIDIAVLCAFLPREAWDALEALGRRLLGAPAPERSPAAPPAQLAAQPGPRRAAQLGSGLLAALLALVLAANLSEADAVPSLPSLARGLRAVGLEQRWIMFSPEVPRLDGWFVLPGRLADGRLLDFSPHGPELRWEKPASIAADFPSARWGILLMHQLSNQYANGTLRRAWVRYLCRDWNRAHPPAERLERVDVFFMLERSVAPGQRPPVVPRYMASHPCPRPGVPTPPGWDATVAEAGAPPPPLARPP